MKSVSLIDKQLHHFNQLKKVDAVLEEAIQEHNTKKEELQKLIQVTTKTGNTLSNEEKSRAAAMTKKVNKPGKRSMELLTRQEKLA